MSPLLGGVASVVNYQQQQQQQRNIRTKDQEQLHYHNHQHRHFVTANNNNNNNNKDIDNDIDIDNDNNNNNNNIHFRSHGISTRGSGGLGFGEGGDKHNNNNSNSNKNINRYSSSVVKSVRRKYTGNSPTITRTNTTTNTTADNLYRGADIIRKEILEKTNLQLSNNNRINGDHYSINKTNNNSYQRGIIELERNSGSDTSPSSVMQVLAPVVENNKTGTSPMAAFIGSSTGQTKKNKNLTTGSQSNSTNPVKIMGMGTTMTTDEHIQHVYEDLNRTEQALERQRKQRLQQQQLQQVPQKQQRAPTTVTTSSSSEYGLEVTDEDHVLNAQLGMLFVPTSSSLHSATATTYPADASTMFSTTTNPTFKNHHHRRVRRPGGDDTIQPLTSSSTTTSPTPVMTTTRKTSGHDNNFLANKTSNKSSTFLLPNTTRNQWIETNNSNDDVSLPDDDIVELQSSLRFDCFHNDENDDDDDDTDIDINTDANFDEHHNNINKSNKKITNIHFHNTNSTRSIVSSGDGVDNDIYTIKSLPSQRGSRNEYITDYNDDGYNESNRKQQQQQHEKDKLKMKNATPSKATTTTSLLQSLRMKSTSKTLLEFSERDNNFDSSSMGDDDDNHDDDDMENRQQQTKKKLVQTKSRGVMQPQQLYHLQQHQQEQQKQVQQQQLQQSMMSTTPDSRRSGFSKLSSKSIWSSSGGGGGGGNFFSFSSSPQKGSAELQKKQQQQTTTVAKNGNTSSTTLANIGNDNDCIVRSLVCSPLSLEYDMLMADPAYRHAQQAGLLWQSIVGQHVRFPTSWWNGSRSPPMGQFQSIITQLDQQHQQHLHQHGALAPALSSSMIRISSSGRGRCTCGDEDCYYYKNKINDNCTTDEKTSSSFCTSTKWMYHCGLNGSTNSRRGSAVANSSDGSGGGGVSIRNHPILNHLVVGRASAGKLLLHIIVQCAITRQPILDIAIGCYHPNARGIRVSEHASRSNENCRIIWIASRKRHFHHPYQGSSSSSSSSSSNGTNVLERLIRELSMADTPLTSSTSSSSLLMMGGNKGRDGRGKVSDGSLLYNTTKSPLGLEVRVTNHNVRAVFGETPPLETLFLPENELFDRISERWKRQQQQQQNTFLNRGGGNATHKKKAAPTTSLLSTPSEQPLSLPLVILQEFVFAE